MISTVGVKRPGSDSSGVGERLSPTEPNVSGPASAKHAVWLAMQTLEALIHINAPERGYDPKELRARGPVFETFASLAPAYFSVQPAYCFGNALGRAHATLQALEGMDTVLESMNQIDIDGQRLIFGIVREQSPTARAEWETLAQKLYRQLGSVLAAIDPK